MALLKDGKIKVVEEDRYGRTVAKVYIGRYVKILRKYQLPTLCTYIFPFMMIEVR